MKNFVIFISVLVISVSSAKGQTAEEYNNLAREKYSNHDYRGAIDDCNKAIKLNPSLADSYHNRGISKRELEDYRGAIDDFNKTL